MVGKITESQYSEIQEARDTNTKKFIELLEEYAGIVAEQYTAFQFFDSFGDFIGDSSYSSLSEILENVGIEVVEDDKNERFLFLRRNERQ